MKLLAFIIIAVGFGLYAERMSTQLADLSRTMKTTQVDIQCNGKRLREAE